MKEYDPLFAPDPDQWQNIDENVRIDLVRQFHRDAEQELPEGAESIHSVIHVVVENQIAMKLSPVPETIDKLIHQGLDRHEAVHAVGAVLSGDIFELLGKSEDTWKAQQYRSRLEKLTAKRWRKGKW